MQTKVANGHKNDVERFLEDLQAVVHDGQDLLKAGVSGLKEQALVGARTTDRQVRAHPYQTIGMMFGLGVLTGLLASRMFGGGDEREEM